MKYNANYKRYVSKDGIVFHVINDRLIKCNEIMTYNGYVKVTVKLPDSTKKIKLLHRVVYETFVGEIPAGFEVDHINNDKTDNRLENLQLLSKADNLRKAHKGKHKTSEHRAKISAAHKLRHKSALA